MFRMACIFVCLAIVSNIRWRGRDAADLRRRWRARESRPRRFAWSR